jgi:hypothetical protein
MLRVTRGVTPKRLAWAEKVLTENLPAMSEDDILEIAHEVGLDPCITYNEETTGFDYDLTDLQSVALAAAIYAALEADGYAP